MYIDVQVERGKQAHYCYDEAELRKLQRSFPANASYNIQRFKGGIPCRKIRVSDHSNFQ